MYTLNLMLCTVSLCLAESLTHCMLSVCLLPDACHEHRTPHYRGQSGRYVHHRDECTIPILNNLMTPIGHKRKNTEFVPVRRLERVHGWRRTLSHHPARRRTKDI